MSVYFTSVPLQPGKSVATVTLPAVSRTHVTAGLNAMHILSATIG